VGTRLIVAPGSGSTCELADMISKRHPSRATAERKEMTVMSPKLRSCANGYTTATETAVAMGRHTRVSYISFITTLPRELRKHAMTLNRYTWTNTFTAAAPEPPNSASAACAWERSSGNRPCTAKRIRSETLFRTSAPAHTSVPTTHPSRLRCRGSAKTPWPAISPIMRKDWRTQETRRVTAIAGGTSASDIVAPARVRESGPRASAEGGGRARSRERKSPHYYRLVFPTENPDCASMCDRVHTFP
jgi:hypothetical protein